MEIVVEFWDLQFLQLYVGRIERKADGKRKLCVHQEGNLQEEKKIIQVHRYQ